MSAKTVTPILYDIACNECDWSIDDSVVWYSICPRCRSRDLTQHQSEFLRHAKYDYE